MPRRFSIQPAWREKWWSIGKPQKVYAQGDPATSVMLRQEGGVNYPSSMRSAKKQSWRYLGRATFSERGAWQARKSVWGRPPRLPPRLYWSLKKTR